MIQNEEYIQFDIKALFFHILRKWKAILIFAVVVALVLGGWMAYSEYKTSMAEGSETSYWRKYQQYQDLIATYEDHINVTQERLDNLQKYMDESVLMRMDPRNAYRAKAVYYVDSGYQIMPQYTYQDPDKTATLTWYYRRYITNYEIFEEIGKEIGLETKYVVELVEVTSPNESTFYISVRYPNAEGAMQIMDMLQNKLDEATVELSESIGTHTITVMEDTCGVYIDDALKENQKKAEEEILELKDDVLGFSYELLQVKEGPGPDELNVVSAFVKWFLIGGVIGAVVVILYLFLKTVAGNRVYAPSQLAAGFHADVLGEVICSTKALPRMARKINKWEGCLTENSEGNLELIAEKIKYHCAGAAKIALCSDTESGISNTIAEQLNAHLTGISLLPTGNLLKEAAALRTLAECDVVLMVAERNKSRNAMIKKNMKVLSSYDKKLMGFIVSY